VATFDAKQHPAQAAALVREPSTLDLSSAQWQQVRQDVKDRSVFSAHVVKAQFLQDVKTETAQLVSPTTKEDGTPRKSGEFINADTVRGNLRAAMNKIGFEPGEDGAPAMIPLNDARLDLIIKTERDKAWGFGRVARDTDAESLAVAPCWELIEFGAPEEPRDWPARWEAAGGEFYGGGRMIARKDDTEFWQALGNGEGLDAKEARDAIGFPPPMAYNSSANLEDVMMDEAVELGVIERGEMMGDAQPDGMNDALEYSAEDMDPDLLAALVSGARGLIKLAGGKIQLAGGA